jgi:Uncharacterized conserved protein
VIPVIGWLAAVIGVVSGLPQLRRLFRTRDVNGLSLFGWQILLGLNLGWLAHGMLVGQVNLWVPNLIGLFTTSAVLYLMAGVLHLGLVRVAVPGLLTGCVMAVVDLAFGSAVFGVLAIVPAILVNMGQSVELVRAPIVRGVSVATLIAGVATQVFWAWWGFLVPEPGTAIAASVTGLITGFNLLWWVLRKLGLRAFWPHAVVACETGEPSQDLSLPA